ncbi:putative transcription factor & chromatin remodeling ARID family [Helianthus anomalus]
MFGQGNKEYPPKLPNGCAIELLDLYMFVEENEGYQNASKNNKWAEIAMKLGLQEMYAANLRIIYQGYLDLMSWRYNMAKNSLKWLESRVARWMSKLRV